MGDNRKSVDDFGTIERAMRFALWATQLREFPTRDQVIRRFGVTRSTAYRMRQIYAAATGQKVPDCIDSSRRENGRFCSATS